ncbi:MAG: deoxyribodipyrimidine photo-lyase, partial [Gammaproteobacteria bacterium]
MNAALVWFRRDLRLTDNPALFSALSDRQSIIPIFVHAPQEHGAWIPGAASNWWLHHSLTALAAALAERGSRLVVRCGPSIETLK